MRLHVDDMVAIKHTNIKGIVTETDDRDDAYRYKIEFFDDTFNNQRDYWYASQLTKIEVKKK